MCVCCAGRVLRRRPPSRGPHAGALRGHRINLIGTFNVLRFASSAMLANEPLEDGERGVV
jgi:hypothetical protein